MNIDKDKLPHIPSELLEPHIQVIIRELITEMALKTLTFEQMEIQIRCLMHLAMNAKAIHADLSTTKVWANMANYPEEMRPKFVQNMVKAYEKEYDTDLSDVWGDEHWSVVESRPEE